MFNNYLKIALRNLARHKLYTSINIFGLAIGLAVCLAIIGNISYELSFENFHKNRNHIYRVNGHFASKGEETYSARVMAPLGQAIVDEIPEVEKAAVFRVSQIRNLKIAEKRFKIHDPHEAHVYTHGKHIIFAKPEFLEVFTMPLLQGNPETVLAEPFSMLITEKAAQEYLQTDNPIGQVIEINGKFSCKIAGILKDIPQNTQIYCDFLVSYATLARIGEETQSWDTFGSDYTYLLLKENADPATIERKIPAILKSHLELETAEKYAMALQPLEQIYFSSLGSMYEGELKPMGESSVIIAFGLAALFILLQAIANFINLSTARSADRMKEVGVRKVFGAFRNRLVAQFLGESIIIAFIAMAISLAIYEIFKLRIEGLLPREMLVDFYNDPFMLISTFFLIVAVGVVAGSYPALYLSRFKPVAVLQSRTSVRSSKSFLRKVLVVFQFGLAIFFTITTMTAYRQFDYITSIDLGFDTENMLVLNFAGEKPARDIQLAKNEISKNSNVISATAANSPPGIQTYTVAAFFTGEDRLEEDMILVKSYHADHDFISTFGLEITQGRDFSPDLAEDVDHAIIINESTVRELGLENPIGHKLYKRNGFREVVGVVKDFHGSPLDISYRSMSFILLNPDRCNTLTIKLSPGNISNTIAGIEKTWKATLPDQEFNYTFLDEEIATNYNTIQGQGRVFLGLAVLTIAIACLGIFGLISFTAEQRTREIGIRKVLGSSVAGIVALLSKEFVILIAIANIIAWPVAYLMSNSILQQYPFRISLGFGTFILAGFVTALLALITASYQSIKAAIADPVKSLRYE